MRASSQPTMLTMILLPMMAMVMPVPLHATTSPAGSPSAIRGVALGHRSCRVSCHDSLGRAARPAKPLAMLICSIECRDEERGVVPADAAAAAGTPREADSAPATERGWCGLCLPLAQGAGRGGRGFSQEQAEEEEEEAEEEAAEEAEAPSDLGASVFGDAKATPVGSSIPEARLWEPGADGLRPKRYGGFMERMRGRRLLVPQGGSSPGQWQQQQQEQQQEPHGLRKRYGGFMRRVGRPWLEAELKKNEGFMRRLFGVSIRSDDGQSRDYVGPAVAVTP
uniref:Proenkephalin-A-like n=1 Tax=Petromyzon marinus TaxID=7757 RepID=A0AAJ7T050_PETMA|nr:proenkephalin-A-like [Petromyzon marinus]